MLAPPTPLPRRLSAPPTAHPAGLLRPPAPHRRPGRHVAAPPHWGGAVCSRRHRCARLVATKPRGSLLMSLNCPHPLPSPPPSTAPSAPAAAACSSSSPGSPCPRLPAQALRRGGRVPAAPAVTSGPKDLSITDTRYADTGTGTAIRRYGDFQKIRIRRYGKYIYF